MKEHPMTAESENGCADLSDPRVKNRQMRWHVLLDLIEDNEYKNIVEVGSQEGRTPWYILTNTKRPDEVSVSLIDPYEMYDNYGYKEPFKMSDAERAAKMYLSEFIKNGKCTMHKKYSNEGCREFEDESVDLVFIDANHSYNFVKEDIECWYPKIRPGGILAGHDYCSSFPGVEKATREYFEPLGKEIELDHNSVWIVRK
jgi:hypothetical protein